MSSDGDPPSPSPLQLIRPLPDDVAWQCLARTPRSRHPILSLVCKSWRSALRSPFFFTTRSLLRCAQPHLYLTVRIHNSFCWSALVLDSNHPTTKPALYNLAPIPSHPVGAAYAAVGATIYVIGGSVNDVPSRHVFVYDCRFDRWEAVPRMRVGREFAAAGEVDGRIYVMGGCAVDTWAKSANWVEVFDPTERKWAAVESPIEVREKWMHANAVVEGRLYAMADRGGVVFDPRSGNWESVGSELDMGWRGRAAVVDGVLYCYDYLGKIRGFDFKDGFWKEVKGVEKRLPRFLSGATMGNLEGGRLVVLWEEAKGREKEVMIWAAEIKVEKEEEGDGGLKGEVVWLDMVNRFPKGSAIVNCIGLLL